MWLGLCSVLVPPSPKPQAQEAMVPVEASVKATIRGAGPAVGLAAKAATVLSTVTATLLLAVVLPAASRATALKVWEPFVTGVVSHKTE